MRHFSQSAFLVALWFALVAGVAPAGPVISSDGFGIIVQGSSDLASFRLNTKRSYDILTSAAGLYKFKDDEDSADASKYDHVQLLVQDDHAYKDKRDFSVTWGNLGSAFDKVGKDMWTEADSEHQTLYFYISSHGGQEAGATAYDREFEVAGSWKKDNEFSQLIIDMMPDDHKNFSKSGTHETSCVNQMVFAFQGCYAGGMLDDIAGLMTNSVREEYFPFLTTVAAITSSDCNEVSYSAPDGESRCSKPLHDKMTTEQDLAKIYDWVAEHDIRNPKQDHTPKINDVLDPDATHKKRVGGDPTEQKEHPLYWASTAAAILSDPAKKDFGDAPDSYKTRLALNGPRYAEGQFQRLGGRWDEEWDGQPTYLADGDDINLLGYGGPDDEDGVIFGDSWVDVVFNITRELQNDYLLRAWWDTNRNGQFDHPSPAPVPPSTQAEMYINDLRTLTPGSYTVRYNLAFDPRYYYSRFRLTWMDSGTGWYEVSTKEITDDVKPCDEYLSLSDDLSHGEVEDFAPIPEPGAFMALLGLAATAMVWRRWPTR